MVPRLTLREALAAIPTASPEGLRRITAARCWCGGLREPARGGTAGCPPVSMPIACRVGGRTGGKLQANLRKCRLNNALQEIDGGEGSAEAARQAAPAFTFATSTPRTARKLMAHLARQPGATAADRVRLERLRARLLGARKLGLAGEEIEWLDGLWRAAHGGG